MKQLFKISGMSCSSCAAHVEKAVSKLPGVKNAAVNLLQDSLNIEFDSDKLTCEEIIESVKKAGYGAILEKSQETHQTPDGKTEKKEESDFELDSMRFHLILSIILLLPLMYLAMHEMVHLPLFKMADHTNALIQFVLILPILWVNRNYFTSGWRNLVHFAPNMDSLIALGAGSGVIYSIYIMIFKPATEQQMLYLDASAMIITLITLGKFLEARSKRRTGDAIAKLLSLAPETTVIERDNAEVTIPTSALVVGDVVILRPGSAIPADGVILKGEGSVNESALTGESMPVEKKIGDELISASVNISGFIKMRADRVGGDTTLARIVKLVSEAGSSKAPIAKLADRISGVFVPVVIAVSLIAFIVWLLCGASFYFAMSIAIAVLVVSCPCALGLATPVAIMVGTGKGAECGILFKSAEALQRLHSATVAVLDKTGTVTSGKPSVTDIVTEIGVFRNRLLMVAAALESGSEHPLGKAVIEKVVGEKIMIQTVTEFRAVGGSGVMAKLDSEEIIGGKPEFLSLNKIDCSHIIKQGEMLAEQGKTPLFFASGGKVIGIIAVADSPRPESKKAMKELELLGLNVVLLTGDNQKTANAIAAKCGIRTVVANVMPEGKAKAISDMKEKGAITLMVGDGINDAPALAAADVGMAIGAGTDIAIDAAGVVLVNSSLTGVVTAIELSKAVIRNIKQNLFWAFVYNILCIPLAAGVFYPIWGITLHPVFGAAAMSLSSVCVVGNALRLRNFRPRV